MIFSVFGQRDVNRQVYSNLAHVSHCMHSLGDITSLVLGGGNGLDKLCKAWADETGTPYRTIPPDMREHADNPQEAFDIRNDRMIKDSDTCVVFWDGIFKPTVSLITRINFARKTLIVFPM